MLIDRFLEDATEVDVDALCDGENVLIAGIMEHIEEAGVHSGDSSCVLPAISVPEGAIRTIEDYTAKLAIALNVIGLMNVQYAIKDGKVYVLEVNPRASRTVPYVSKATGVPLPKIAVGLMLGRKLTDFTDLTSGIVNGTLPVPNYFVKSRFPVLEISWSRSGAWAGDALDRRSDGRRRELRRSVRQSAACRRHSPSRRGALFISVNDRDKPAAVDVARKFRDFGFELVATRGTAAALKAAGLSCKTVFKVNEGRPNAVDLLKAGKLNLVIYTTTGGHSFSDEQTIRRNAVTYRMPCITTMSGAKAAAEAVASRRRDPIRVWSLQEIHSAKILAAPGA